LYRGWSRRTYREHQIYGCVASPKWRTDIFENVAEFKYLEAIVAKNYIHEEIKSKLNSGNAYSHSVQSVFSSPPQILKD
jgi:hypothetical protein